MENFASVGVSRGIDKRKICASICRLNEASFDFLVRMI